MAAEIEKAAAELVVKLRTAERLAREGKVDEAKTLLKSAVKEARERGLERAVRNLVAKVQAALRRRTRR